jgi:hypothetical protein
MLQTAHICVKSRQISNFFDQTREGKMAGAPVTIVGVMTDSEGNTKQVTIIGVAGIPGLEVGGGPIIPPSVPPGSGGVPIHPIWGPPGFNPPGPGMPPGIGGGPIFPTDPVIPPSGGTPVFPIWGPPGIELPPGSGYPPVAGHPLPPPGGGTPPQPIPNWKAQPVWTPTTGWVVVLVPTGDQTIPTPSGAVKK